MNKNISKRTTTKLKVRGRKTYRIRDVGMNLHRAEIKLGRWEDLEQELNCDYRILIVVLRNIWKKAREDYERERIKSRN